MLLSAWTHSLISGTKKDDHCDCILGMIEVWHGIATPVPPYAVAERKIEMVQDKDP